MANNSQPSGLNATPSASRCHIGFFGRRNSGKSSLINALTGQQTAIVSEVPGTTTDPVTKAMEIHGLGPCLIIDTAGFDDIGHLGEMRVAKTKGAAEKTDLAVLLFQQADITKELEWAKYFQDRGTPFVAVISQADKGQVQSPPGTPLSETVTKALGMAPLEVSIKRPQSIMALREALIALKGHDKSASLTAHLVAPGGLVLLVMPQDIQAPQGRLILPQVQTLRSLLDDKCLVMSCTAEKMPQALATLSRDPDLIITDSQVFASVYAQKPPKSKLTSFSVLFAAAKGDLNYFVEGARVIATLNENSHILIAECCTHAPLSEDIGREKLPRMLRRQLGENLSIDIVSGSDFPEDLQKYDLIIQCGACMFNRRHVMSRVERAQTQKVPMSNYGVVIAYLSGILDKISLNPQ